VIRILCIGKMKSGYLREGVDDYLKRLRRHARVEVVELPDAGPERESQALLGKTGTARVVLCDRRGDNWTSERLSEELARHGAIDFVLGGPDGVTDALRERADVCIAFGAITLPHELARLLLLEQIYRGYCILGGHPYHR